MFRGPKVNEVMSIHKVLISMIAIAIAKSLQLCLTLCDPIDGSPPGFPKLRLLNCGVGEDS